MGLCLLIFIPRKLLKLERLELKLSVFVWWTNTNKFIYSLLKSRNFYYESLGRCVNFSQCIKNKRFSLHAFWVFVLRDCSLWSLAFVLIKFPFPFDIQDRIRNSFGTPWNHNRYTSDLARRSYVSYGLELRVCLVCIVYTVHWTIRIDNLFKFCWSFFFVTVFSY